MKQLKFLPFALAALLAVGCDSSDDESAGDSSTNQPSPIGLMELQTSSETDFLVLSEEDPLPENLYFANTETLLLDNEGYLVNETGYRLRSMPVYLDGTVASVSLAATEALRLNFEDVTPQEVIELEVGVNLPSDAYVSQQAFSCDDLTTYHSSTSQIIYSNDGESYTVTHYFRKVNEEFNTWEARVGLSLPDGGCSMLEPVSSEILDFNESGVLDIEDADSDVMETASGGEVVYRPYELSNGVEPLEVKVNYLASAEHPTSSKDLGFVVNHLQYGILSYGPVATTEVGMAVNLNSSATAIEQDFVCDDPNTYHSATSIPVYDSTGESHTLSVYYRKVDDEFNTWEVKAALSSETSVGECNLLNSSVTTILDFEENGSLDIGDADLDGMYTSGRGVVAFDPYDLNNGAGSLVIKIDFLADEQRLTTSKDSSFEVRFLQQNGKLFSSIDVFNIAADGLVTVHFTNETSLIIGKVALAKFASPANLTSAGDNLWQASDASGEPVVGEAGRGNYGTITPIEYDY